MSSIKLSKNLREARYQQFILLAALFFNIELTSGLYLSTVLALGVGILTLLYKPRFNSQSFFLCVAICAVLLVALLQGIFLKRGSQFNLNDVAKLGLILTLLFLFCSFRDHAGRMATSLPSAIALYVAYTFLFLEWNTYDSVRARFSLPGVGSPNSTGYLLAFSLIFNFFKISKNRKDLLTMIPVTAVLFLALLGTQSRGALLTFLTGVIFATRRPYLVAIISCFLLSLVLLFLDLSFLIDERFLIILDAQETGGSGRIYIWLELVKEVLSFPGQLVYGYGPVDLYLFRSEVTSAHSMLLQIIYNFGAVGFVLLVMFFTKSHLEINRAITDLDRRERRSVLAMVYCLCVFDSVFFTAQIFWFSVLVLILCLYPQKARELRPAEMNARAEFSS